MNKDYTNLFIGLLLILPGIYLFWYAIGHPDFYREKRWEKWHGRAYLLSLFFSLICRYGGIETVRRSFLGFSILCIGIGAWATLAQP
jgi:hypothetical protein